MRPTPDGFTRSVFQLSAGTALGQGLFIAASPLLSYLYTPQDFGVFATFMAIVPLLLPLATMRYEAAIPLAEKDTDALNLVVLCIGLNVAVSIVIGVILWTLKELSWLSVIKGLWFWIPLSMLLIGLYQTMSFWAIRRKQYSTLARTKLFQAIAGVSAQLGLGWLGAGSIGLIIGEIATRSMGFLSLLRSASIRAGEIQLESIKTLAIRYRRFGLFGLPDALLSVAVLNLPTLLIASLYEPTVVGWFGLVSRLVAAPVGIVGQALAQVYLGQAAAIYREGGSLHSIFTKTLRVLSLWSAIPFAIFGMVVLPYGITTLFDPQWKIAATLAVPMSLWYLGALIVSPLSQTLNILQKQHILLLWNLGRLLATLAVYGWAFLFVPSLTAMVWALALIHFTAYLTLLGILSMNVLQRGSP